MPTSSQFVSHPAAQQPTAAPDRSQLESQVRELGEWFHNLDLFGVSTAPDHFLGDFPAVKWKHIASAIPENLSGASVLDIGCNGGVLFPGDEAARGASGAGD
jgi:tRNA (mo5U34)-methyltransferase